MITANAQDLGILLLEPAVVAPERDGLLRSATGKVQHVKRENDMFEATKLTQGHRVIVR